MSTTITHLRLGRVQAVAAGVVGTLAVNLVLWLIGVAAGGSFEEVTDGKVQSVAPGGVIIMSVVPMLVGLTAAVLISLKWAPIIRIAQIVGAFLSIATIVLTVQAHFDGATTVLLSLMHLAVAAGVVLSLAAVRRNA